MRQGLQLWPQSRSRSRGRHDGGPGTVVAVDDNPVQPDGHRIGKAMYVAQFFNDLGVAPLHTGYQLAWQL